MNKGRERLVLPYSPIRSIVYAALLLALASFGIVETITPDKFPGATFLDWFIALTATAVAALLAIAGGVWLFHYQDRENDEKLESKLAARVAVELATNLERLEMEGEPITFYNRTTGEPLGPPVRPFTPLSTVALRDWMRSNVLEPQDVRHAIWREGRINAHNKQIEVLWSQWSAGTPGLANRPEFRLMIENLAVRQESLKADFKQELQRLRDRGIEVPD